MGGSPVFLGVASAGRARPEIADAYGPQLRDAGYGLVVNGLDPGMYDLQALAWARSRAGFLPAAVVRLTVR